jgi:hypothetical protein
MTEQVQVEYSFQIDALLSLAKLFVLYSKPR